jgi:hypothetical protein
MFVVDYGYANQRQLVGDEVRTRTITVTVGAGETKLAAAKL